MENKGLDYLQGQKQKTEYVDKLLDSGVEIEDLIDPLSSWTPLQQILFLSNYRRYGKN